MPKETVEGERRVGLVPDGVEKLRDHGLEVVVEAGAGRDYQVDERYREAGAEVVDGAEALWRTADLVAKVLPPTDAELERLREGAAVVSLLQPVAQADLVRRLADRKATVISMDAVPRIARAQSMDALSSMSSVGGYKSVLIGASALGRYLPMMTTAAGTIKAARVLVLGAGVAGLQAIATARRLGADVTAFDIRPEVKEQIESLGATFLEEQPEEQEPPEPAQEATEEPEEPRSGVAAAVDWLKDVFDVGDGAAPEKRDDRSEGTNGEDDEGDRGTTGGYAREQAEEKQQRDREMIKRHLRDVDVVITTALVPGRPAPKLLTADMVEVMRPGSVIVDLAAEAGGNCELTRAGEVVEHGLVHIHGPVNLPSQMPIDSSALYSRNVVSLLTHLTEEGELTLDFEDEITDAVCVAHGGSVRSEATRGALDETAAKGAADR